MTYQTDAQLMREMLNVVNKTHGLQLSPNTDLELDEDITRLKRATTWLKGLFSKQQRGVADVLRGAAPLLRQFERYMGRKNQTYENLTWQTIVLFLGSNAAQSIPVGKQRGVPLNLAQIGEILDDATFRNAVQQQLLKEKVAVGSLTSWFPTSASLSAKRAQPVGGPTPTNRARRSEIILHNLLEAAVSKMFDIVDAAVAAEPETAAPTAARAPSAAPASGTAAPQPQPAAQPAPAPAAPQFTPADLSGLQSLLAQLQGKRTP